MWCYNVVVPGSVDNPLLASRDKIAKLLDSVQGSQPLVVWYLPDGAGDVIIGDFAKEIKSTL
jgi:hypothetical protein